MRRTGKKKFINSKNLMAIFIVVIMVFSIGGIIVDNIAKDKYEYNGYDFISKQNSWSMKYEKKELLFDFFPKDVENIEVSSEVLEKLMSSRQIDSTFDPTDRYVQAIAKSQYDMNDVLSKSINAVVRPGMTMENEYGTNVIVCGDVNSTMPVLYFKESNVTKVSVEGDCITVEAKSDYDLLKMKDRLLYGILGIIE